MEKKNVYIVVRENNHQIMYQFAFANKEDAQKCANRLTGMYPEEKVILRTLVLRETYN